MKLVCLIRPSPPMIYFVNRINEAHPVHLVVAESPSLKKTVSKKLKSAGLAGLAESFRNKIRARMKRKEHIEDYKKYFGTRWQSIDPSVEIMHVENINHRDVKERVAAEKPDVILDHGTSIVKKHILEVADIALNLHWGLSPYYRGSACTEWALVNWDPLNIGVTIHKLTKVIDGGAIVAQARGEVSADDTVHSINMQLTMLGTELIVKVLDRIEAGQEIEYKSQDHSMGFLTTNKQMTTFVRRQVEHIEKTGTLEIMLKKPARRHRLPIVELPPD